MVDKKKRFNYKKLLKIVGWIVAGFIVLLTSIILLIRLPVVQNKLTQKAISFLKNKIGTEVQLKSIFISFPKNIVLEGLYLEDQKQDTLLFIDRLSIDTDLWELTNNTIELNQIELENTRASIKRSGKDSNFNFTYIIQAFAHPTVTELDESTPWTFAIEDVQLSNVSFNYNDDFIGTDAEAKVGSLKIQMDEFDLAKNIYKVDAIDCEESRFTFIQKNYDADTSKTSEQSASISYDVDFGNINFKKINLKYANVSTQQRFDVTLGELSIAANQLDLIHHLIDLDKVELHGSFVSYSQYGESKSDDKTKPKTTLSLNSLLSNWNFNLNSLQLSGNGLQYYDFGRPVKIKMFDDAHIWIRDLTLEANDLKASKNEIHTSISNLSFSEKNGFNIKSLNSQLKLTNTTLDVSSLEGSTQHSILNTRASVSFESLNDLIENYENADFEIAIDDSKISLTDVLYFSPSLLDSVPLNLPAQTTVAIDTKFKGRLNNLAISQLNLRALANTSIDLHGSITGLPDVQRSVINVSVEKFYTTNADIKNILADSLIPTSIQMPEWLQLSGKVQGSIKEPNVHALLTSDAGKLEARYKTISPTLPTYDAMIIATQFDVGKVLKQKDMGRVDLTASVKGSGLTMDSLDAAIDVLVKTFEYSNYEYHDFKLNGTLKKYFFTGEAILKDKNLDFELKGDMDYQNEIPNYKFKFNLVNADFQELHLSERPLKARARLDIDLATSDFKIVNGTMGIRKVAIYNGKALYNVDSLLFASIDQQGESELSIRSDILSGDFKGTFNVFQLPKVLKQHINHYFALQDKTLTEFTEPQNFTFDLTLKNTDLLTEIILPELSSFVPGKIQGEFDSEKNSLALGIEITKLRYATTSLDSFVLNIDSDQEALRYSVKFNELAVDTLRISALRLEGQIANNIINTKLLVLDSLKENKYALGGVIKSIESNFRYSFVPDQVLLNYNNWSTPSDNYLQIGAKGIVAHNFSISKEAEKISVVTNSKDSTVSLEFLQWQLSTLTRIVEGVVPADGEVNGSIKFTTARKGEFSSVLQIKQLSLLEKKWGDASFSISHKANRYALGLEVKGDNVDINGAGYFIPGPESKYDIDVAFSPFNLSLIEPLSFNQLKEVKGSLEGKLKLSRTMSEPSIRGKLTFKEATFISTYLNNSFSLTDETISFEEKGIVFNNFKLTDVNNNNAILKGSILTKHYSDFDFDIRVTSQNFQVLNTQATDNELYYGNLKVNAKAYITGNMNQPNIEAALSLGNGSQLTYVVPEEEKSALEQKGIVRFVNKKAAADPFLRNISLEDTTQSLFRGMDVNATIELTDKSILNIVVDPVTGDKLSLKGSSTLVFNSEASGTTNLSGRYEITSGTYNFSFYKLLKREFNIVKGSSITWSGDPLNASMDLRAMYRVEASPLDLVYNQIPTTNQNQLNSYQQRLPFLVYLNIKGVLLVPQISFTLDMPDDKRNVFGGAIYSKLQDINTRESDLNKQVFALLILKRFISDNPLESQAGSSISNTTRVSVSRMLSEQLNRLSQNVKGVELNFDIKSYENNMGTEVQGQTKLQLGLSKNLFKDRLVVKLAGNLDIEGESTPQNDITDYIGDLALEYKITPDGRFRITGFRNSNYDMIDGQLTETGAGLIYIKDYNTLRELLMPNEAAN